MDRQPAVDKRRIAAKYVQKVNPEPKNSTAADAPAANGMTNPTISLSAVILLLFFAKVVINFLTLQRCMGEFVTF